MRGYLCSDEVARHQVQRVVAERSERIVHRGLRLEAHAVPEPPRVLPAVLVYGLQGVQVLHWIHVTRAT